MMLALRKIVPWRRAAAAGGVARRAASSASAAVSERQEALVQQLREMGAFKDARVGEALCIVDRAHFHALGDPEEKKGAAVGTPLADIPAEVWDVDMVPAKPEPGAPQGTPLCNPVDAAAQLELLAPWLRPGAAVLDCGSGSGYLTTLATVMVAGASENGGAVVGVDVSTPLVDASVPNVAACLKAVAAAGASVGGVKVEASALGRVMLLPVNGTDDVFLPKAPYNAIRVGFALPSADGAEATNLLTQLRRGGRMLAHVGDSPHPMLFDKAEDGSVEVSKSAVVSRHPPPLAAAKVVLEASAAPANTQRDKLMQELQEWKAAFEAEHGRAPSRQDVAADPHVTQLFMALREC